MTTRPSHAALVEEVATKIAANIFGAMLSGMSPSRRSVYLLIGDEVLSLIAARLSDVTPEMVEAVAKAMAADEGWGWDNPETLREWWINQARASISAFLASSPLTPGDGNKE